jgi:DNA-binding NtrC family response regulator
LGQLDNTVVVVDADPSQRTRVAEILSATGRTVRTAASVAEAALTGGRPPDLVIVASGPEGLEALGACRIACPDVPVIVRAAAMSPGAAMEAIRAGAFEYVPANGAADDLLRVVATALRQRRLVAENRALRRGLAEKHRLDGIVGRSERIVEVFKTAARVAATNAPVLLVGEPGTGREILARAIHAASACSDGAFVPVDCVCLPDATLEAELLGSPPVPGARAGREGIADAARAGTLYLDAIGHVGPGVQAALLRALEDGVLRRPGSAEAVAAGFRLVASTDEDLRARAREGRFREDLLLRIEAVTIHVPPLRERREDVPLLAAHFAAKLSRSGRGEVAPSAMHALMAYSWPGNVRELETAVGRALALSTSDVVLPENLPGAVTGARTPSVPIFLADGARPTLSEMERRYAAEILRETGGNKTRAAEILGIDRKTLYRLIGENGNGGDGAMTPLPALRTPPPKRSR